MKTYKPLTYQQRCQIYALKKTGMRRNKIAKQLDISLSTITQELFSDSLLTALFTDTS